MAVQKSAPMAHAVPSIESFLAKLVPNPTPEDTDDMSAIAFACSRIATRRAQRREFELIAANEKIKELAGLLQAKAAREDDAPPPPSDDE